MDVEVDLALVSQIGFLIPPNLLSNAQFLRIKKLLTRDLRVSFFLSCMSDVASWDTSHEVSGGAETESNQAVYMYRRGCGSRGV